MDRFICSNCLSYFTHIGLPRYLNEKNVSTVMVINSTANKKTTSHFIEYKKNTMIHADRNPDPGFGEARKCNVVIPVNGIQTHSLIIGSPTPIQIKKTTKSLHRFASTENDQLRSQK